MPRIDIKHDGRIMHIVAGDDNWNPTKEEMDEISSLFATAMIDPKGAVVVTRAGVSARFVDDPGPYVPVPTADPDTYHGA